MNIDRKKKEKGEQNMKTKKTLAMLLTLALVFSLAVVPAAAGYTDTEGHWADPSIERWSEAGILKGGEDGTFRPNDPMTRAEFAVVLDRLMDYQTTAKNVFTDVDAAAWYADALLGANAAGVLKGTNATTAAPGANITREQAMVLLGRALGIAENAGAVSQFTDAADISAYAKGYVGGLTAAGLVNGTDGKCNPQANITRAEVVAILDRAVSATVTEATTYSTDAAGNVIVSKAGATLKDMTVSGNLIIAEGVGTGNVTLNGVTVKGNLVVRGGGEHSVIITGNSDIGTVIVDRKDGALRVSVEGGAKVETVIVNDGCDDVKVQGSVGTLIVKNTAAPVEVAGKVTNLEVPAEAAGAKIVVAGGATVTNLTTAADNVSITGSGKVTNLTVTAGEGAVSYTHLRAHET